MQFSAFGYRHSDSTLSFPSEILRPIGIGKDKTAYCMYYPAEYSPLAADHDGDSDERFNEHGFMLTPVLVDDWPRSVRITITLQDRAGALNAITSIVKDQGGSIGFFRGGSGSSSCFVLNMTVSFPDVNIVYGDDKHCPYDSKKGFYVEVYKRAKKLAAKIRKDASDYLYLGEEAVELVDGSKLQKGNSERYSKQKAVVMSMCTSLCYFWRLVQFEEDKDQRKLISPFQLSFGSNNRLKDHSDRIREIIASRETFKLKSAGVSDRRIADYHIGGRPIYASVDTKDQTIRFRILNGDSNSSLFAIQVDWERAEPQTSNDPSSCKGVIHGFTEYFEKERMTIKQIHSKEFIKNNSIRGRFNAVINARSLLKAKRFIRDKSPTDLSGELNEYLLPFRVRQERVRVMSLTQMQSAAWQKSDVGLGHNRMKFLISASAANDGYVKARTFTKELNELGYTTEFIADHLHLPESNTKSSSMNTCLDRMRGIVTTASVLFVLVDDIYGKIIPKDGAQEKELKALEHEELAYLGAAQAANAKVSKSIKVGFYSEMEAAMAFALGITVIPIAYRQDRFPSYDTSCIFSGHNTAGLHVLPCGGLNVVETDEKRRDKFHEELERIYLEALNGMNN